MIFCTNCSSKMQKGYQFCPLCGTKAVPRSKAEVDEDVDDLNEAPLVQKKPMPRWFKIASFLTALALIAVTAGILFTESLVDVVDHQLEAIRGHDIEKAYSYTSKEFRETTSLDQFRQFIQTYPIFMNNQSANFTERRIKDKTVKLKGALTSNDRVSTPIEYRLNKEGKKWKISTITLLKPNLIPREKGFGATEDLVDVATEILTMVRSAKAGEAYQQFTSVEFKKTTSESDFFDFIRQYPMIDHYQTMTFPKAHVTNGLGTLGIVLTEGTNESYVKCYFVEEDLKWKLLSMRILSPEEESVEKPIALGDLIIGSEIDEEEIVVTPVTKFQWGLKNLYVNLDIENGVKDGVVDITLKHLDNKLVIPTQIVIEKSGDNTLVSKFAPPEGGWLKGEYRLIVTTGAASKTIDFDIE